MKSSFLSTFFDELNLRQIDYFVIGNYLSLPESTGMSDLDVIIAHDQLFIVQNIIKRLILNFEIKIVSTYKNENAFFYRFLCAKTTPAWGLQLDIFHKGLFYHNKAYFPVEQIKNNIIVYNNIKVLDLEVAYAIGYLKELIHTGRVKHKYLVRFYDLFYEKNNWFYRVLFNFYGSEFVELLDSNKFKNDRVINLRLQKIMKSVLFPNYFSQFWLLLVKISNINRLKGKPGFTLEFLGPHNPRTLRIQDHVQRILDEAFHNSVYNESLSVGSKLSFKSIARYYIKILPKVCFKSHVYVYNHTQQNPLFGPQSFQGTMSVLSGFLMPKFDITIDLSVNDQCLLNQQLVPTSSKITNINIENVSCEAAHNIIKFIALMRSSSISL